MLTMVLQTHLNDTSITMNRIRPINPVAKAVAHSRRRASALVVPPKKGKGAYKRTIEKSKTYKDIQDDN